MDIKEAAHLPAAAESGAAPSGHGGGVTARRGLLAAGIAGAVSLLPWLDRRASASTPGTDTGNSTGGDFSPATSDASDITTGGTDSATEPSDPNAETGDTQAPTGDSSSDGSGDTVEATTTTAPPKQPTPEDITLLDFAQSVELTARDLYDVAIASGAFDGMPVDDITAIREAHEGYATAISGLIGRNAMNRPNAELFAALEADFSGDATAVAMAAATLEDSAVATHLEVLGELAGIDGAALIASILVVEARNATLLKVLAGTTDLADQLAADAEPLSPSDYPVE